MGARQRRDQFLKAQVQLLGLEASNIGHSGWTISHNGSCLGHLYYNQKLGLYKLISSRVPAIRWASLDYHLSTLAQMEAV